MGEAASQVASDVLRDYSNLAGREEEITAQLRGELNRRLLGAVQEKLDGFDLGGCKVKVATFKKKQESSVGADLAGIFELEAGGRKISKAYLAQAKVGSDYIGLQNQTFTRATNKDLLTQAESMLNTSSDSFIFVYSPTGIHCIPAFQVLLSGSNTVDTGSYPVRSFASFYEEFVKCFIGDHKIAPEHLHAKDLEDYAEKISANAALQISVKLPDADASRPRRRT